VPKTRTLMTVSVTARDEYMVRVVREGSVAGVQRVRGRLSRTHVRSSANSSTRSDS
jgi:hypothetical protein